MYKHVNRMSFPISLRFSCSQSLQFVSKRSTFPFSTHFNRNLALSSTSPPGAAPSPSSSAHLWERFDGQRAFRNAHDEYFIRKKTPGLLAPPNTSTSYQHQLLPPLRTFPSSFLRLQRVSFILFITR